MSELTHCVDDADSETTDNSGTNRHVAVLRACLQCAAQQSKQASDDDGFLASVAVSEPTACKASEDSTEIVHSNETALLCCVCDDAIGSEAYSLDISGRAIDKPHNALIIPFKDESHS